MTENTEAVFQTPADLPPEEVTERTTPVGGDFSEALDSAKSPMEALVAAYNHAPHPAIRAKLNQLVEGLLITEIPQITMLLLCGPAIAVDKMHPLEGCFLAAMEKYDEQPGNKSMTATVRQISQDMAILLDSGVKRILLEDTHANREAYNELVVSHAQMTAALSRLALSPEQQAVVDKREAEARADNDKPDSA